VSRIRNQRIGMATVRRLESESASSKFNWLCPVCGTVIGKPELTRVAALEILDRHLNAAHSPRSAKTQEVKVNGLRVETRQEKRKAAEKAYRKLCRPEGKSWKPVLEGGRPGSNRSH
jgi:predicted nucleotide-binding protein (sugar kinase/HSP70/actin superfamily)